MKIFVTGGSGFVGSHFVNLSLMKGWKVVAHRRSVESKPRVALLAEPKWVTCSLDELTKGDLSGCGVLVHLASHTPNPPYDSFERCFYWNVIATLRLFDLALEAGVKRFVVAGSCFEYGKSGERYDFIPPDAPLEPTTSYPASKAAASVALQAWAVHHIVELWIGRIFQVFGPGEPESRLWPSLRKAACAGEDFCMTKGEQIRDFISVESVAACFVEVLYRTDLKPGCPLIENIGTGQGTTLKEFSEYWWSKWRATGSLRIGELPYRPQEVMRYVPEVSPQRKITKNSFSLELADLIAEHERRD
ncbi:MAG: NAD(P)-dependent oxidoreductase [Blastochloris sp.]|nr:NAD(P)-dependent oxidoreductase [Blastochloris sp.]